MFNFNITKNMIKISKLLRFKCGIYCIFNQINGKKYIGSSIDIYNRFHEHLHLLKRNSSHNNHLQNAWNKYGEDAFDISVLEFCNPEIRFSREQYYIKMIQPEYNLTESVIANYGHSCSEETKLKISETLKKRYKLGELHAYKQDHAQRSCKIYDIHTYECFGHYSSIADACRALNYRKGSFESRIIRNKYCVIFDSEHVQHLEDYINEHFKICKSFNHTYLITESPHQEIKYHLTLQSAASISGTSKGCLQKHPNITKCDPYITKTGYKVYYSDTYIPINNAVQDEESPELLSGNIGETPEMDNTEINSENKESESSYSVDGETFKWKQMNMLESGCYSCEIPRTEERVCKCPKYPCSNYSGYYKRI